jgi:hypothetical protein
MSSGTNHAPVDSSSTSTEAAEKTFGLLSTIEASSAKATRSSSSFYSSMIFCIFDRLASWRVLVVCLEREPVSYNVTKLLERRQRGLLSWRLNRVTRYETESIALYREKAEDDLADRRRFGSHLLGAEQPEDVRANLKAANAKYRLPKRFPKLPDDKRLSGFDADSVLWDVMEHTDCVAEGKMAPEVLLEEVSIPSLPECINWEEYQNWTAETVRAGIEVLARAADEDPEKLLGYATDGARRDVISRDRAAERVKQDLEKMSRERLLPDEKTLEKVASYEAHLSRGLYKALHELEALQTRRLGGSAPLARLDVDEAAER